MEVSNIPFSRQLVLGLALYIEAKSASNLQRTNSLQYFSVIPFLSSIELKDDITVRTVQRFRARYVALSPCRASLVTSSRIITLGVTAHSF